MILVDYSEGVLSRITVGRSRRVVALLPPMNVMLHFFSVDASLKRRQLMQYIAVNTSVWFKASATELYFDYCPVSAQQFWVAAVHQHYLHQLEAVLKRPVKQALVLADVLAKKYKASQSIGVKACWQQQPVVYAYTAGGLLARRFGSGCRWLESLHVDVCEMAPTWPVLRRWIIEYIHEFN